MSVWEAVLLGILQGATEFLPVSSSGHLVLGQALMGLRVPGVVFEAAVHLATLISVVFVYRDEVGGLITGAVAGRAEAWRYLGLLALATVPAAAIGLLFRSRVEALFEIPTVVGVAFLVTGVLLWTTRWTSGVSEVGASAPEPRNDAMPGAAAALAMGVAQAFALVPGISRSGVTVVVGLWLGVSAEKAAEFSFLMAVPAIAGAAILQVPELVDGNGGVSAGALVGGSLLAAVTGILAIRTFVAMLRRRAFHLFAPYLWLLGALFLGYLFLGSGP